MKGGLEGGAVPFFRDFDSHDERLSANAGERRSRLKLPIESQKRLGCGRREQSKASHFNRRSSSSEAHCGAGGRPKFGDSSDARIGESFRGPSKRGDLAAP